MFELGRLRYEAITLKMEIFIIMSHSQMLGKFEYGGGPIFKVVIEC